MCATCHCRDDSQLIILSVPLPTPRALLSLAPSVAIPPRARSYADAGETPLYKCASPEALNLLLARGGDINLLNAAAQSVLFTKCAQADVPCVRAAISACPAAVKAMNRYTYDRTAAAAIRKRRLRAMGGSRPSRSARATSRQQRIGGRGGGAGGRAKSTHTHSLRAVMCAVISLPTQPILTCVHHLDGCSRYSVVGDYSEKIEGPALFFLSSKEFAAHKHIKVNRSTTVCNFMR